MYETPTTMATIDKTCIIGNIPLAKLFYLYWLCHTNWQNVLWNSRKSLLTTNRIRSCTPRLAIVHVRQSLPHFQDYVLFNIIIRCACDIIYWFCSSHGSQFIPHGDTYTWGTHLQITNCIERCLLVISVDYFNINYLSILHIHLSDDLLMELTMLQICCHDGQ